jgi:hypothetical protein
VVPPQVSDEPPLVSVSVDWSEASALNPRHVNQLATQLGGPTPDGIPDGIYLALGEVVPPILAAGDAEKARKLAAELQGTSLTVIPHGRFHLSRSFLDVLMEVLQTTAAQHDSLVSRAEAAKAREGEQG